MAIPARARSGDSDDHDGGDVPPAVIALAARDEVRRMRRLWLWLGGLWLALGVLGCAIIAGAALSGAAAARDRPWLLFCVLLAVAVLPGGATLLWARRPPDAHPLVRALEGEPARLGSVELGYDQDGDAEYHRIAIVTLSSGVTYTFAIPSRKP